jgi:WD40 repeat protein
MGGRLSRFVLAGGMTILAAGSLPSPAVAAGRWPDASNLWIARYDGPASGADDARAVAVSPDGSTVYVTGSSEGGGRGTDYETIAYDTADGSVRWTARYDGPASSSDVAGAIAVSSDGAMVVVTGSSRGGLSVQDYATLAYDATTGTQLWLARYRGVGVGLDDGASAVALSPDDLTVFVTGTSDGDATQDDWATVAYDAATGSMKWGRRFDGPAHGPDSPRALSVSSDGSTLFAAGTVDTASQSENYLISAMDAATGSVKWSTTYNGVRHSYDTAGELALSPDGSTVYVTGTALRTSIRGDVVTLALDATDGSISWSARYDGPAQGLDAGSDLAVSPDGASVVVAASSQGPSGFWDYQTIAYDAATGASLWQERYEGPGDSADLVSAVGISGDGTQVVVTGTVYPTEKSDIFTIAYSLPTGDPLWSAQYSGPGDHLDQADALAIAGDRVFITGSSEGTSTGDDYVTLAYSI